MSVKFVLFDAFGPLVRTPKASHPYRQILKEGIRQGRRPRPEDLHHIMTRPLSLSDAAEHFGIKVPAELMAEIQGALETELSRIEAYEDGLYAVERLQAEGVRIAIASNLAAPYAAPVRRLYPTVEAFGFSFAVGALKPEPFLYRATCELLGAE
ncbi:HAD family hydrolase [Pseudomonas sp.]|uniref:HAD family hydrolase n=1 Tax=Pseudomonas sp. TaxID=306 RepID=UPI0026350DBB|nr:HAD family hydrolase [Pseudomonas sp.]